MIKILPIVLIALLVSQNQTAPTNDVTCFIRALFQNCTDSNNDYLAQEFLSGYEQSIAKNRLLRDNLRNSISAASQNNLVYFSTRTNYIDDIVKKAIQEQNFKQVVIIAAGKDSRPYRFNQPNVQYFEVDMPEVVAAKQTKIQELGVASNNVQYIGADLSKVSLKDALTANSLYKKRLPSVYIVEGLIYYLQQSDVNNLFQNIGELAAKGSYLTYDYANKCLFKNDCKNLPQWEVYTFLEILNLKKEPWRSGMQRDEQEKWLSSWGFKIQDNISYANADTELGVKSWTHSPVMSQMNYVKAIKR